ncbi:uncharacterized protein N0V89_007721 [Didymosphaeria variabile]|uniref:Chitin-binding type-4 domain-containing protein n=1 Tax=Didymosphaeria variabile TaxID=1932322 RepID=A0A9W9CAJ5_9PLEO|nr:uncharacterized protein N0V89_007721 [Didymosphaeria variabile]KAJ4352373.1 hypothetical protein N0V89_007721 [Didymosphaeria variabile]
MKSYTAAVGLAAFASQVAAHGYLTSPKPRMPGDALTKACGSQINSMWSSDINGNVQTALQIASSQSDYDAAACNIWQCKGMKYEDNTANVQSYTAGEKVPITFNIAAPHTGTANMSVVDTKTNTIIGSPLITFDDYASTATGVTDAEKNFDITIPSDLGSQCATAGDCVLQFWWDARSVDQTYESCIDFTVGGSGSGSGNDSSSAPASSAPAASATAPASSAAPASSTPAATSAAASATATVADVAPSATSAAASAPAASATGSASGSTLPEEFTVQEFISWLKTETGTASKKARRHARAFF